MGLLNSTLSVDVYTPETTGYDALGNPVNAYTKATVEGVLIAPESTADLGADRPEGYSDVLTLCFPKSYTGSLRGAYIELPSPWPERVEVIGDPMPWMPELTPGAWNLTIQAGVADG